ncbi:MAG: hypothetical protein O2912_10935, partial [Proteobacteria bacterium]|nr:hypothetical protein [Pseudomonadota bacterium]
AGKWLPEALDINDRFIAGLQAGRGPCYSDDHMVAHHVWSYLLSARHFVAKRAGAASFRSGRAYFPGAGLLVDRRDGTELYAGLNKGGVFKLFRGDEQIISDTQLSFKMVDGATAVCHMIDDYTIEIEADRILVSGDAGWAKQKLMTLRDNLILRSFMFLLGRFFPNLVRRLLQAMLITHKRNAPFRFSRGFHWREGAWQVVDEVYSDRWADVASAGISGYQTSIFVIQSRPYQQGQHQVWNDLSDRVREFNAGEALKIERIL